MTSLRGPFTRAGAPLRVPNLETTGVNLKRSSTASREGDFLYPQLLLRDDCITGVAYFPVAWTTEQS
jgi:hypothetical protein